MTGEADFPDQRSVRIGGISIHVIHGHQVVPWGDPAALLAISHSLDADLLVHGHTHTTQIWYDKSSQRLLLNPGSTTGAYSPFNTSVQHETRAERRHVTTVGEARLTLTAACVRCWCAQ